MAARKLRAVAADEKPTNEQQRKLTVAQAAATGDHRKLLVAMRERIARTVSAEDCPPRDLAALTRRLQDIAKELEAIDQRAKEDGADAAEAVGDEEWSAEAL